MNPLISVIVPVYKVEAYLPRCLESIVNQTYRNLEIILVDDGSPDRCPEICDEWAAKDSRIRVIHQENKGISAVRNTGLETMRGEIFMFVDSDDWISADAVQCLYDRMIRDQSDMVIGQMVKIFDDGHTAPSYCAWMRDMVITGEAALGLLSSQTPIPCYTWGKLTKRSVFENIRFPNLSRAEDVWVLPYVLDACSTISLEGSVQYFYYQRGNSIVHSSKDEHWLDSAKAAFHVTRFLLERGLWESAAENFISGLTDLKNMKDLYKARQLLMDSFTRQERQMLTRWCPKCRRCVIYLRAPRLYNTLRKLLHKVK